MLKIGIIGCGNAAARHASGLLKMREWVRITACCDIDSVHVMAFRKEYAPEAEVFTDVRFMLESARLDAVLVASWPVNHREQIEACINAGVRNIMVEKPLTITANEAYEIFKLVEGTDIQISESNAFMFQPGFLEVDKRIAKGELAPADTIHATFCKFDPERLDPSDYDLNWRQRKLQGGGVPWEFASFIVTACNHFAADLPVGVYSFGSRGRYDTITRMHGMIEYLNGCVAFIHADKHIDNQVLNMKHGRKSVILSDNCWNYDGQSPSALLMNVEGNMTREPMPPSNTFLRLWTDFVESAEKGVPPSVPFIHSVVTMYTLDALVASMLQQVNVELDIPEEVMQVYEATLESR